MLGSSRSPLLSTKRGRGGFQPAPLFSCQSQHVVYALLAFWVLWVLALLTLLAAPSLMDPLVQRHARAEAADALAREHDGPNHHHGGLPGMVERTHGQHTHLDAAAAGALVAKAAAEAAATEANSKAQIIIPGINDVAAGASQHAAPRAAVPVAATADAGSAAAVAFAPGPPRSGVLKASPQPPVQSSTVQPAVRVAPGATRSTPPGSDASCHAEAKGPAREKIVFPQYALGSDPSLAKPGGPDDYSSDEAPLRQLAVTTVHPTRATYEWTADTKQRGVLVYMCTSEPDDIAELRSSLQAIASSYLQRYPYPVAIFHEDYSLDLMRSIQESQKEIFIYFVQIRFQLPKHLKPLEALGTHSFKHRIPNKEHPTGWHEHLHGLAPYTKRAKKYPYGYQHMCRFFSGAGFMLPFFEGFDWYWRLDSDTTCRGTAPFDIFDHLSSCSMEYSHLAPMFGDGGDVVEGLWNAVTNFTKADVEPAVNGGARLHEWGREDKHHIFTHWGEGDLFSVIPSFNTNCEIASLAFLRSEVVQKFHRFLDAKGGYFLHRWGDAPVRFMGVAMSMDEQYIEGIHALQCHHN